MHDIRQVHRRIVRNVLYVGWVLVLCLLAGTVVAQSPQTFDDTVDVRVINVEVVVTDRDGAPVHGLQPDDFRLVVDGVEEQVAFFSEIRGGAAVETIAAVLPTEVEPVVATGEPIGTSYLLFVDRYFGINRDIKRVLTRLARQVDDFGPHDRMAIVSYDGRRLDAVLDWTASRDDIRSALTRAAKVRANGLQRRGELQLHDREVGGAAAALIQSSGSETTRRFIQQLKRQVDNVLKAATTSVRTFADTPGRKVLLLTAGGWPIDPVTYTLGIGGRVFGPDSDGSLTGQDGGGGLDVASSGGLVEARHLASDGPASGYQGATLKSREAFQGLVATANTLGFTVYPIDLPGRSDPKIRVDEPLGNAGLPSSRSLDGERAFRSISGTREEDVESTSIVLAKATGGVPLLNGLRDAALTEVQRDTGAYYWLGFAPSYEGDDSEHTIEVEVADGLRARNRTSYRDLSRRTEVTMQVESHLLFESAIEATPLPASLGQPTNARGVGVLLPVTVEIPLDALTLLPTGEGFQAQLELRVAIVNELGDRISIPVIPINFSGTEAPTPGQHYSYETTIRVRKDKQRLVLALHDLVGDAVLATALEVEPKKL